MFISESNATFSGNISFIANIASYGGSLYLFKSSVLLNGINFFANNNSPEKDVHENDCCYTTSKNHPTRSSGGAIFCDSSTLTINTAYFYKNFALQGKGGAISAENGVIVFQGTNYFVNNFALGGGAMLLNDSTVTLNESVFFNNGAIDGRNELLKHLIIKEFSEYQQLIDGLSIGKANYLSLNFDRNNSIDDYNVCENSATLNGGAVQSVNTSMTIDGEVTFGNNTAFHGGAMFLTRTKLLLSSTAKAVFIQNRAYSRGGAIYVKDSQCSFGSIHPIECFLSIEIDLNRVSTNKLIFFSNSAESYGSNLYGGQLNECRLYYYRTNYSADNCRYPCGSAAYNGCSDDALRIFMNISIERGEYESFTNISSQADQIKFCEGDRPQESPTKNLSLHPGEEFNITVIAFDQVGSPVPTIVFNDHDEYTRNKYRLRSPLTRIIENTSCANVTFQLLSDKEKCQKSFKLYPDNPCQSLANGLKLQVEILACPIGFELKDLKCQCDSRLSQFTQICTIRNHIGSFKRNRNNFWISRSKLDANTIIIHEYRCPLDYCKDDNNAVNVTLEDPSVQCDFNRIGLLCGQCGQNFDLAFGSLHCIPCNNNHSALILFFALAGMVLVAVVFILRLTVSVGTLNGLLFYANIIQGNHQAYFPRVTTRVKFFTIFISWLNLDLI